MSNSLNSVTPRLLAQGLLALRQNSKMAMMVNRGYEAMAGQKGSTIDVPIPSAISVQDVLPGPTPQVSQDSAPTHVPIVLDRWKEAPFYMDDKDLLEVMEGTIPMQASEAIKALANEVDTYLLGLCRKFYGFSGTPGVTPFQDGTARALTLARKNLQNQLAPNDEMATYAVMNPDAEAEALNVRAFTDASFGVGGEAIMNGNMFRRLGFNISVNQNVGTHIAGTAANATVTCVGNHAPGTNAVLLQVGTGSATLNDGDILTFANHSQTYVVDGNYTLGTTALPVIVHPRILAGVDGTGTPVSVEVAESHAINPCFHRDAIAFASRPLGGSIEELGGKVRSIQDPISKLTLRLEISREHKRTRYSFDILYGAAVVRREFGTRLAG